MEEKDKNVRETAPFSSYMFFCSNSKLVFSLVDASEHQGLKIHDLHHYWIDTNIMT